jgi:DNA polymerase-1
MIKIHIDPILTGLGWFMVMQIHDEVVMEGPSESAETALARLTELMENPLDEPLRVALTVDAKIVSTWYEGK